MFVDGLLKGLMSFYSVAPLLPDSFRDIDSLSGSVMKK
jgi:hypothetical protein